MNQLQQKKRKTELFFDLDDDQVSINFQNHLEEKPSFNRMAGPNFPKARIHIDLYNPQEKKVVNEMEMRRILKYF